jgi:hypothetical protein
LVAANIDLADIRQHTQAAEVEDTDPRGLDNQHYCYIPSHINVLVDATIRTHSQAKGRARESKGGGHMESSRHDKPSAVIPWPNDV